MAMLNPAGKGVSQGALPVAWRLYERMDQVRVRQGEWLEALGWGARETPARAVLRRPGLTLKGYAAPRQGGPVVLLVPAPIKRSYIWDLAPGASVVQACLAHGMRPYLVQWEVPEDESGLQDYGDRFLAECIEAIRGECGPEPVVLAGHSLGGILAAVFAAVNPDLAGGLVLLGAPLNFSFSREHGALGPVIEAVGARGMLESLPDKVPGSVMSVTGFMASPAAFGKERWSDWFRSLPKAESIRSHMQVERWSFDELPLAGRLVEALFRDLYRGNALMAGTLPCGGKTASVRNVVAPLLVVAERQCAIVPPSAILPFFEAASSREKRLLWYDGDVGVAIQHVGSLVGKNAHTRLWPEILGWIRSLRPRPAWAG